MNVGTYVLDSYLMTVHVKLIFKNIAAEEQSWSS